MYVIILYLKSNRIILTYIDILLVAPVNLTAQIVSSQMLMISWSYPSLLVETAFEVHMLL